MNYSTLDHQDNAWTRVVHGVIHFRWLFLLLAVFLGLVSYRTANNLSLDRRLETMFRVDDPLRRDFEFLKETFGGNEVVLCAFSVDDLWDKDGSGIEKIGKLSQQLKSIPGVQAVMDLSQLELILQKTSLPTLATRTKSPQLLNADNPLSQSLLHLFSGYTHLKQGRTAAVACLLEPQEYSSDQRAAAMVAIAQIVQSSDPPGQMIGEPVMIADGFRLIESDGWWLGIAASIVLGSLLLLGFRSLRWTIAAIAVVQWSLIVTQAILVWTGLEVTMVSSMLSSIVTIIGVATTIHWMLGHQRAMDRGLSPLAALHQSLHQMIRPIVWACVTDAVGFASLMVARVGPVRDYGLMMSIASLVVLAAIFLIIPGVVAFRASGGQQLAHLPGDRWLGEMLSRSLIRLERWRAWVWVGLVVVVIWSVAGSFRIQAETDFIKNFREHWPIVKAYEVVEVELGGAGVWDILLPAPNALSREYLTEVGQLEDQLRALEVDQGNRLTKVLSVADAVKSMEASPVAKLLPDAARLQLMRATMPAFMDALLQPEQTKTNYRWLRLMLRSPEHVPAESKLALIRQVRETTEAFCRQAAWGSHFPEAPPPPKVTGHYVLLTRLVASLVEDQWRCFFVATAGVGIVLWLAVRNWKWILLALIPNALPALLVLGTMGWLGWKVNLGAALIAAVSIGISVDSSLHYLLSIQSGMRRGQSQNQAIDVAQREVGMAMLISTLALVVGFGWLATSQFLPTVAFGITASLTMIGGLIGNLWLLPLLIKQPPSESSKAI